MANYADVKAIIDTYIKRNGIKAITGNILNGVLNKMLTELGAGYQYGGMADPSTDPGTPDYNVVYLAATAGTYTDFDGILLGEGEIALLKYNGSWSKDTVGDFYSRDNIDSMLADYVRQEPGKGLSTNDYTDEDKAKLDGVEDGAQVNVIEGVSVNGTRLQPDENKVVDVDVPTDLSELNEDAEHRLVTDDDITNWDAKYDKPAGGIPADDLAQAVRDLLALADSSLQPSAIVQETGQQTGKVMSQKAVTDAVATVAAEVSQLGQKVVEKAPGKNLYDGVLESGYFNSDGTIEASSVNSHTKNYIPVEPETQYHISRDNDGVVAIGAYAYICFYDAQRQFLSSQTFTADGIKNITTPVNCYFLRTTIRNSYDDAVQIEKGSTRTAYEPYNPISEYLTVLPNNSVGIENIKPESFDAEPTIGSSKISRSGGIVTYADRELVKVGCKNIYDNVIDRGYFKPDGTIEDSGVNYHTVNYLPVRPNTQYHLSSKNNGYVAFGAGVYICYYDSGKNFLSSESFTTNGIKDITTPQGCYYIRTTVRLAYNDEVQVELGNARTAYVPYNPIYNYLGGVRDMENELKKATNLVGVDASVAKSASLSADTSLTLPGFPTRLKKRLAISFTGKFSSFSSLSIGQNYKTYDGAGIKIDGTNVYAMNYFNGTEGIRHTVPHGISSFANYISVTLYIDSAQTAFITIVTDGGSARVKIEDYNYAHSGTVFANPAMAMTDVKLNATCADFRCPVWAFGDSYFGLSIERVGYWLRANGFFNILFDGLGGENATGAMSDLNLCLNFGTPKYIVWALGMNGAADSSGQPNATWLAKSQELIALCDAKGITPIFCTIPTVPGIVHEALSAWVRSSGYRYIDVADAVGSQADGTWYDGMLSTDNVHPTEFGAKVIAQRWLIDFPEIMEYGIVSPSGENTMITV